MDSMQPEQYQPIGPGSRPGSPPGLDRGDPSSGMPCELCGQGPASIQDYMWVMSFVALTRHREYSANLCRACATRTALKEQAKSALLGWWGIPWGLLTFKALWVNARALARWSTLPALAGMLTLVAGLVVPAALGYSFWGSSTAERQARSTGDWVSNEVLALMDEGNAHSRAGEMEKALASYRAAYEKAPGSSAINATLARVLIDLDRNDEALPYAARAAKLNPADPTRVAMYGYLLAVVQGPEAAQKQATALRRAKPLDVGDALWIAGFFDKVGEYDQVLRVARAGLAFEPANVPLTARELAALVELDRLDEAGEIVRGLGDDQLSLHSMRYAQDLYRMRTEPLEQAESRCTAWEAQGNSLDEIAGMVRAAERAGKLEEARAATHRCLNDPATPPSAWASAAPWFGDSFTEELDAYLANHPEPLPALLRLAQYDPVTEAAAIRRLASRIDAGGDPLAQFLDGYAYGIPLPGESLATLVDALERHLETAPDHALCRSILAGTLAREAPERAASQIQILDLAAQNDPALAVAVALDRTELHLALGELGEAVASIAEVKPDGGRPYVGPGVVDVTAAEAAFHAGKPVMLRDRLAKLLHGDDGASHAAALLIRWSDELAAGAPITYREDVDQLLDQEGDSLLSERSPSAQGILIAEGRVSAREREALVPEEQRGTLVLVRLFRDAAEHGTPDLEAFSRLAASPHRAEFAPLLARTALARRQQGTEPGNV